MAKLQLTFACGLYDRMQALYTGEVQPDGIDLNFIAIDQPRPIFDRMSGGEEFDVAEYSSSEYVQRYANKKCNFVAIPVFPSRTFRHSHIGINKKIISKPKDLEGKRIGVALYTMTAAIFIRGILQHDHGVDFSKCTWVQGAINAKGAHGSPTVLPLLKPVKIEQGPPNKSLDELLQEGVVDATIGTSMPESFRTNPNIGRLFPDFVERERDHYKRTKIFPIMHTIVIREEVYEQYPWIAQSLFKAFNESKRLCQEAMYEFSALKYMMAWSIDEMEMEREALGPDPWAYGLEANRHVLETLVQYTYEQGLISKKLDVDSLFAKSTLEDFKI